MAHGLLLAALVFCAQLCFTLQQNCYGLECESKETLLSIISQLQKEKHDQYNEPRHNSAYKRPAPSEAFLTSVADAPTFATCSVCNDTSKCINGGTCVPDLKNPFGSYYCLCPDNTSGQNCQNIIKCNPNPCGPNADCFVQNHQLNCICRPGYSGSDPRRKGCGSRTKQTCMNGDPHYITFDNLHFDYQGTCPYIFSQPCTSLAAPYAFYSVRAKNELLTVGSHVASVSETEVDFYNRTVHIDGRTRWVFVDGLQVRLPWYYPNKDNYKISIKFGGNTFTVRNDQNVVVTFTTQGILCVEVPDVPEFNGQEKLCGLGGNIDGKWSDDVVYSNGTIFPITSSRQPSSSNAAQFLHAEDTWITENFLKLRAGQEACVTGEIINNSTNCDPTQAAQLCLPIQQAERGEGTFAACQALGNDTLENIYYNCMYDTCRQPAYICTTLYAFVQTCQSQVPYINFPEWRQNLGCNIACPMNSHYESCTSSCPASCAEPYPEDCDRGCTDGCACDPGFVIDNTVTTSVKCIPLNKCGCQDQYGNSYPAGVPWITDNCTIFHECRNGSLYSEYRPCSEYGTCSNVYMNMQCSCLPGYTGDGYTCTDIDECLDPHSCSVDKGQGTCTNLPGTYSCKCKEYYSGHDCEFYMPRRHCADLYVYWKYRDNGVYNINPPYVVNGNPPYTNYSVFCDMASDGGGFTRMSSTSANIMANKTFQEYVQGFGDPDSQNVWIGLDLIHGMTTTEPHTLRLDLFRCASNGFDAKRTDCTYGSFTVLDNSTQYAVVIPKPCEGSESAVNYYHDGWARWNLTNIGPKFSTYDLENSNEFLCSKTFQNTGWWFDTTIRCGSADLNGIRFTCDNMPTDASEAYLTWAGDPLGDAWLSLRPAGYPNYDR